MVSKCHCTFAKQFSDIYCLYAKLYDKCTQLSEAIILKNTIKYRIQQY